MSTQLDARIDTQAIPIRNVWYLLLYAWDLARWQDRWSGQSESAPNLLGLFARVLASCTSDLLRRQLGRIIRNRQGEIRGIRGKVDFAASLKRLSFENGRAVCRFPEPTVDTLRNRILRSTLNRLAHDERIRVGAPGAKFKRLRHDLIGVVKALDGVKLISVQSSDFARLQLGRNDRDYQLPLAICALVHRLEMPLEASGDQAIAGLLHDEMVFSDIFEKAIRNFYRLHLPDCRVKSEQLSWPDEIGLSHVPIMITDTTIETRSRPLKRMVIDTKYYSDHLVRRYEGIGKFRSEHLYQIYSYLRTQESRGEPYRCAEGVLLYPSSGGEFDEAMLVQGHRIRIRTVDLTMPWQAIESSLMEIVRRVFVN